MEENNLINEQRDIITNELQLTKKREIVDGKMVEVIILNIYQILNSKL